MAVFLKLVPFILQMMVLSERLFIGKPQSGAEKKAVVMGTAQAVVGAMQTVSTGGQKETWDQLADPVSQLIDSACTVVFKDK